MGCESRERKVKGHRCSSSAAMILLGFCPLPSPLCRSCSDPKALISAPCEMLLGGFLVPDHWCLGEAMEKLHLSDISPRLFPCERVSDALLSLLGYVSPLSVTNALFLHVGSTFSLSPSSFSHCRYILFSINLYDPLTNKAFVTSARHAFGLLLYGLGSRIMKAKTAGYFFGFPVTCFG